MYVKTGYPDVLYMVKPSEDNEELRYSVRSLKNLNHGRVFMAGHRPSWADSRIEHIPAQQTGEKYDNIRNNWMAALDNSRLSDDFVLMNDDFFIMKPTKRVPTLRRLEDIDYYITLFSKVDADSYYVETMRSARDLLLSWGINNIDSYELHVPMVFNKQKLRALIDKLPDNYPMSHIRTIYGNYYDIGGKRVRDVKVLNDTQEIPRDGRFLSTIDESFNKYEIGRFLRKKFAKVLVFAHANDPDGLLSVILAQLAFTEVDYLLTNKPQTDISAYISSKDVVAEYDYIFMSDIYPGRPVLTALPEAYWFDHKQYSVDKIQEHRLELPNAIVKTELNGRPTSGSELFYEWLRAEDLLSNRPVEFVEYIRQVDNWDFA